MLVYTYMIHPSLRGVLSLQVFDREIVLMIHIGFGLGRMNTTLLVAILLL